MLERNSYQLKDPFLASLPPKQNIPNVFLFFCSLPVRVKELASTFGQLDKVEKAKKDLENDVMSLETKYAMSSNSHCKILKKKKKEKEKFNQVLWLLFA